MGHDLFDDYLYYQIMTGEDFKNKRGGGQGGGGLSCVLLILAIPVGIAAVLTAIL